MNAPHKPEAAAPSLTVPERLRLFCAASGTDWLHAGITGDTVTVTVVEGLVERPELGRISLTEKERAALVGLLKDQ